MRERIKKVEEKPKKKVKGKSGEKQEHCTESNFLKPKLKTQIPKKHGLRKCRGIPELGQAGQKSGIKG